MIVSHKHKFIFVTTAKTASTSAEIALSSVCGPDDILTPIKEEEKRTSRGFPGPQNCDVPFSRYNLIDVLKMIKRRQRIRFHKHVSAREIRRWIGKETWNSYYKFCFERNPWDKAVSRYYWEYRKWKERPSFDEFMKSGRLRKNKVEGYGQYTINGQIVVDRIFKYEDIGAALKEIARVVGLPNLPDLPDALAGVRKDKRHYSHIIPPQYRDEISAMFKEEIDLLGYEFEEDPADSVNAPSAARL